MADDGELASLGGAPPDSDPEPIGSRRRITVVATVVLLVAGVVAVLLFFGPSLVGLDKGVKAAEDSDPLWLIGAFVPSALAFFFYAWLFHQVIHRSTPPLVSGRFTWSTTMVSTMAGQAATRIVSAGGAGAAAVLAWVLRRAGLEARAIGTVLGLAVIASVPMRRILKTRSMVIGAGGLAAGAGVFGFASGIASGTGVILVSLLLGAGLTGQAVLATDALATIALDLCKAALFQRFDLLDAEAAATGAVIGLATIPGSAIAAWLVTRLGATLHVLFIETLILAGGLSMIWQAWR